MPLAFSTKHHFIKTLVRVPLYTPSDSVYEKARKLKKKTKQKKSLTINCVVDSGHVISLKYRIKRGDTILLRGPIALENSRLILSVKDAHTPNKRPNDSTRALKPLFTVKKK